MSDNRVVAHSRTLSFFESLYGFVLSMGSVGALVGSILAERIAGRLGIGPVIIESTLFYGIGGLLLPLASISTMGGCAVSHAGLVRAEPGVDRVQHHPG